MKATTAVTLFIIIFLIAVGWSAVEVNAAEAAERDLGPFDLVYGYKGGGRIQILQNREMQLMKLMMHLLKNERELERAIKNNELNELKKAIRNNELNTHEEVENAMNANEQELNEMLIEMTMREQQLLSQRRRRRRRLGPIMGPIMGRRDDGCCVMSRNKPPRKMGDIWITVGLSTVFLFFMVLTLRVFRNLERQRKSCRKTHAFPTDDLGGITNLPG